MKYGLLILFTILFVISIHSAPASNVKFYSINDIYGISMRETASVCKDNNGFIWASSKTGIMRIAGNDCRIYQLPFKTLDILNVKLACKNPILLAYSNNGQVCRYHPVHDRFELLFDMNDTLNGQRPYVSTILIDNRNNLWIPSTLGFYKYQNGKLIRVNDGNSEIMRITDFDENHLLLTSTEGIYLMDMDSMKSKLVYSWSSNYRVSSLFYYSLMNKLWIGTMSSGLLYYDFTNNKFVQLPAEISPKQPVLAIEPASDSTLFVGIDGKGIRELDKKGKHVINIYRENLDDNYSIRGNGVYAIFNDTENQKVWVCTYSGGLSYFEQSSPLVNRVTHQINNPNSLANNNVNQIIEDSRGNIWFATGNGISCLNVKSNKWQTFFHDMHEQAQVFLSLCEDDRNRIWAGTYSSGVYVLDGGTGQVLAHYSKEESSSSFNCNFTYDIIKDCDGNLWLGGVMDGVFRYVASENIFETSPKVTVYSFEELSGNEILAACTSGLYLLDKQAKQALLLMSGYTVLDILVLDGNVWMCTQGNGLVQFNPESKTTREFTTESGLLSNYVNSIMLDDGYLWLGTEAGLCRFNPVDETVTNYSSFLQVSFNRNACCRLCNGQLAWGTNVGAIIFDPLSLQQSKSQGRIFVQDILVSGRSIRDDYELKNTLDSLQEITLPYNRNSLAMEFLPLGTATAGFRFSWFMEGFDTEQSRPAGYQKLTYTNIPIGKYVLKIMMYDDSTSRPVADRQFIIRVTPPFWKMWWFRLLFAGIATGIIYSSLYFYINRLKQRHAEDKVRFFTNVAHEIRTALTLIKAPIEEISRKNFSKTDNYYLDTVAEQTRRLSSTVTHLLDFQKADIGKGQLSLRMINVVDLIEHRRLMFESFGKSKNVVLFFTAEPSAYSTAIDELKMEKVIDNLISNAIKYSHNDSRVQLLFAGNEKYWTLEVTDYGIGISRKTKRQLFKEFYRGENAINSNNIGSGVGLLLSKKYVELHGGAIYCESRENAGSTFKIKIPFKKVETLDTGILFLPETGNTMQIKNISSRKMRLLVVEDNEDLQNFMICALCEEFEVSAAKDGVIAWEIIRDQMPDIVVSDVMMPNMDGFELCRLIKSTYETSHIPVVLLTALSGRAEQLHGLGLGADNYLTKPFDMTLVAQCVRSVIQNRKAVREKALKLIEENNNEILFTNELNDKFMKKAVGVVRTNIANSEFDKDDFASAMHVSSSLLYKKIKSLTDQSPIDFVKTIRLNYALELLQSRKYTITEVSELCGFSGINYFGKAFKKYFGKLPSEI